MVAAVFVFVSSLVALMACAPVTEAQFHPRVRPEDVVSLKVSPSKINAASAETITAVIVAEIKEGYHIQSHKPLEEYLIPASVNLVSDDFVLEEAVFPEGKLKSFSFSEEKVSVYNGIVRVRLAIKAREGTAPGNYTLSFDYHYQACNDRQCLRPTKKQIALAVTLR